MPSEKSSQKKRTRVFETLIENMDPIEVGNFKLGIRKLIPRDLFAVSRIMRDAALWGGLEVGQKLARLLSSMGDAGSIAGLLLAPIMGVPEVETQLADWIGSVFLVIEEDGRAQPEPYLPLGRDGFDEIPLDRLYGVLQHACKHPDFESFFMEIRGANSDLVDRVSQNLKKYWPLSTEDGSGESTESSTAMDGQTTQSETLE